MRFSHLVLALGIMFFSAGAYAAEDAAKDKPVDPSIQAIRDKAADLSKNLTKDQADALAQINAGFGMTRAVSTARADVSRAVDECSKKNPDQAKALKKEFSNWSGKIDPLLKDHQKKMKKSINGGIFEKPEDINAYIDLIDKAAREADAKLEKNVVTTPEACSGTREALVRTGDSLSGLLEQIRWPEAAAVEEKTKDSDKSSANDQ